MTQALLNNLIKQPDLSEKLTSSKIDLSSNFEKIFKKQNIQEKEPDNNLKQTNNTETQNKNEDNDLEKSTENNSIEKEIKDLIAYLEATKNSSENASKEDANLDDIITDLIPANLEEDAETEEVNTEEETIETTETKEIYLNPISQTLLSAQNFVNNTVDTINENTDQINESEDLTSDLQVTLDEKEVTSLDEITSIEQTTNTTEISAPSDSENQVKTGEKTLEDLVDEEILKDLKVESAETETESNSDNHSDLLQNQSPEEQGIKAVLQADADFSTELKQSIQTTSSAAQNLTNKTTSTEITPSKIIEQITKQMESLQNNSKVNIVLNPENLGKVTVQLINTKEGLSAQFTVASQEARNLIMKGLDGLKDSLISHGVSIDNVTVKLNDTQESEYNSDWTEQEGSRGGNKEQQSQKGHQEREKFDQMMSLIEDENGNV